MLFLLGIVVMTKKSKKKAIKTGTKCTSRSGLITSVHLGFIVDIDGKGFVPHAEDQQSSHKVIYKNRGNSQCRKKNAVGEKSFGLSYHFDIWFHIGKYVAPEHVKKYSLICHACWEVTRTKQFWLSLYKRNVCNFDQLPGKLNPSDIDAGAGIFQRVVRALYHVYPPFTSRKKDFTGTLLKKKCMAVWWVKECPSRNGSVFWSYFFKFFEIAKKRRAKEDNIHWNTEEHNIVLKVKCPSYIHFYQQSLVGLIITSFNECMTSDMRYHQLRMTFHVERKDKMHREGEGDLVVINPVIEYAVIPWWNPRYPYPVN